MLKIGNNLKMEFCGKQILINLDKNFLSIDRLHYEISPVYNDRIINASKKGKVFIDKGMEELEDYLNKPLYFSSRNIMKRKLGDLDLYMDFLVYNYEEDVLPNGTVNRSLGHNNDINEFEVHQVLNGIVLSLIRLNNNDIYLGIFGKGDYFEIPPGAFHCSYILNGPALVANFYCNAYWGSDINKKPYFQSKNDITIEKHSNTYLLKSFSNEINISFKLDDYEDLFTGIIKPYRELYENGLLIEDYKYYHESIFDLFFSRYLKELLIK